MKSFPWRCALLLSLAAACSEESPLDDATGGASGGGSSAKGGTSASGSSSRGGESGAGTSGNSSGAQGDAGEANGVGGAGQAGASGMVGGSSSGGSPGEAGAPSQGSGGASQDPCGGCDSGKTCIYQAGGPGPSRFLCAPESPCASPVACGCIMDQGTCAFVPEQPDTEPSGICVCDNGLE